MCQMWDWVGETNVPNVGLGGGKLMCQMWDWAGETNVGLGQMWEDCTASSDPAASAAASAPGCGR